MVTLMKNSIRIKFAENLRRYRSLRKLTQQRLAELADIEYKYIQRLEGKKPPAIKIDTIAKLAKAFKISPSKLLA
jgi:transcriptional regulator with XRE-family HTH domain